VVAIADAGARAHGATAVVTLEPCRHTGRTGPCTSALITAGVARVVFAQSDPTAQAGGGAEVLRAAGVDVVGGVLAAEALAVNEEWTFAVVHGRPFVTWKSAVSLDGRVAGPDGGPTRITGDAARREVHALRAQVGAVIVGTGTVLVDDPGLTVRLGETAAAGPQPLRVIMGSRPLPPDARVLDDSAPTLLTAERDPAVVLADLFQRGVRHALLEGGPTLASAFLASRVVDRVRWYTAPLLLGAGAVALPALAGHGAPLGVAVTDVSVVGEDVRVVGRVQYEES
jgi:diaminohydroxyphosphoribosylaminopyrimidine deaminase/5-amino-6-(5-phosphoribosylamino)uracil reductase